MLRNSNIIRAAVNKASRVDKNREILNVEMATALAHEVKNPATLALAHVDLIRSGIEAENPIRDNLGHIENALFAICGLVQEMLAEVYGDSNFCEGSYEIDIHDMLDEMLEEYQAAHPNITFTLAPISTHASIRGQDSHLRMIFSNLLKNAIEAVEQTTITGFEGHIFVVAEVSGGGVNITIRDNGISSPSFLAVAKTKPHGNGLGLPICHHLAEKMGGNITICSDTAGGCVVFISFPKT